MTTPADLTLPEGAPEEVITHAILRPVDLKSSVTMYSADLVKSKFLHSHSLMD